MSDLIETFKVWHERGNYHCAIILYDPAHPGNKLAEQLPPLSETFIRLHPGESAQFCINNKWPEEAIYEVARMFAYRRDYQDRKLRESDPVYRLARSLGVLETDVLKLLGPLNHPLLESVARDLEKIPTPDLTPSVAMQELLDAEREINRLLQRTPQ